VIIREIGSKSCAKRFFVDRDDVIEAFPSDRSNQAFDIARLPGGSRCREYFSDAHAADLSPKHVATDGVPIAKQVARSRIPGECLKDLICGPFSSRMGRYIEMQHASAIVSQDEEYEQDSEADSRNLGGDRFRCQSCYRGACASAR